MVHMLNLAQNDHSLCDLLLSVGSSWWNETHLYILFVFNEDHYICRFGRLWTVNRDTWTEMDYTRPWLSQLLHNKAKTSMKNFLNHSQDRVIYSFAHRWKIVPCQQSEIIFLSKALILIVLWFVSDTSLQPLPKLRGLCLRAHCY